MLPNELYELERHTDFLRQAEHDRLILEAAPREQKSFYKPALAALGAQLVKLGNRLQDNVDSVTPTTIAPAGDCI